MGKASTEEEWCRTSFVQREMAKLGLEDPRVHIWVPSVFWSSLEDHTIPPFICKHYNPR